MRANGKMIKEMVLELKFGQIKTNMKVIGKMIKKKVKVDLNGIMVTFI